jgi:hypothetical protein
MSDLERRLRAALHAAAEQPPPSLMDAVLRRHRRHRIRVGASLVAVLAAVAVAVPPVASVLRGAHHAGVVSPTRRHVHAAPGTVLSGCASSNIGQIDRHWKNWPGATHAGAVWVLPGSRASGQRVSGRPGHGAIRLYVAIVVVNGLRPGSAVQVRAADSHDLRFLYGPHDSLSPGRRYTMRSGEAGVTFLSCAPGQETFPVRGYTDYYGGYLVRGVRCARATVDVPGWRSTTTIAFGACRGR